MKSSLGRALDLDCLPWNQIPTVNLVALCPLGKVFNLSVLQFLHLQNGNNP